MKILSRKTRSTSADGEIPSAPDETPDPDFWSPQRPSAWPGKADEVRTLRLPAENPNLLSARPDAVGGREYAAALAEAEYEFAVMQNLQMLEAN